MVVQILDVATQNMPVDDVQVVVPQAQASLLATEPSVIKHATPLTTGIFPVNSNHRKVTVRNQVVGEVVGRAGRAL